MKKSIYYLLSCLLFSAYSFAEETIVDADLPRIFIASDSTAAAGGSDKVGWGTPFADYFNPEKVEVLNKARGGRSSRTFITEGHWDTMLLEVEPGDLVLIQFGHNDFGAINQEPPGSTFPLRARASIKGLGDESELIDNVVTGKRERVYTYGYYMRKMVADTRAKGAIPVFLSLTARNIWENGRLERGAGMYGAWTYQLGKELNVPFVDLSNIMADDLEPKGPEAMSLMYPNDHTHTNFLGADAHASAIVSGLKGLRPNPVEGWLSEKGEAIKADELTWLNIPRPADKNLPNLFLIGDSTVRNERGDGNRGQWGWGDYLDAHFNVNKINVVNRAVGGLSSRTYYTQSHWAHVLSMLKPGDFVMMQFGHNDNIALNDSRRARGTIKGVGTESEVIENMVTGKHEVVHTYGWYLRQFIAETQGKGAIPLVCSLVPRKTWSEDGTLKRSLGSYASWAKQVALQEDVPFIDLHNIIADRYDALGRRAVDALFADEHTHTSKAGAILNAECVAEGLRRLPSNPLNSYMTVDSTHQKPVRFSFVKDGPGDSDAILVDQSHVYDPESGYGYDLGTIPCGNGGPFYFSINARDGNYRVTIEFGDASLASSNTIKVESRRLLLEEFRTEPGEFLSRTIIANTRNDQLTPPEKFAPGGRAVVLNEREIGKLHWDNKLTLEFNGSAPQVRSVQVEAVDVPTVYLVGDSTVTDQPYEPAASWGQMLSRFFKDNVAVANHAESGETMKSFISGLRLAKVLEHLKEGDYLFIQFTHNDQKAQWPQTYVEAGSTYKAYLKVLIEEARVRGATPVLVTSMQRRRFDDAGKIVSTLGDYPQAMRELAEKENVALIDLERMSVDLYEALGEKKAPLAFSNGGKDATHHNNYGAYQLAQCVAQGIVNAKLPLANSLVDEFRGYNPKHPDDVDTFFMAPSPIRSDLVPFGN